VQYGYQLVSTPRDGIMSGTTPRTPASTLVMSRTLMPASGPSPLVEATEAKHLRRSGRGAGPTQLRPVLSINEVKGLGDVDMVIRGLSRRKDIHETVWIIPVMEIVL
jgi:hypothetical protein